MRKLKYVLVIIWLCLSSTGYAQQCSCRTYDTELDGVLAKLYGAYSVVRAKAVSSVCFVSEKNSEGIYWNVESECEGEARQRTQFKLIESYKDNFLIKELFFVTTKTTPDNCGLVFDMDEEYLLYLPGDRGQDIGTSICAGSRKLSEVTVEELSLVKSYNEKIEPEIIKNLPPARYKY